jgi:hypothetical protein
MLTIVVNYTLSVWLEGFYALSYSRKHESNLTRELPLRKMPSSETLVVVIPRLGWNLQRRARACQLRASGLQTTGPYPVHRQLRH